MAKAPPAPITWDVPIVDDEKRATQSFMDWLNAQLGVNETVPPLEEQVALNKTGIAANVADITTLNGRNINTETGELTGGGDLSADRTLGLADTAVTPGTYGSATKSAVVTVDQKGRLTTVTEATITGGGGGGLSPPVLADFPNALNIIAGVQVADGIEGMCISSSSTGSPNTRGRFKTAFGSDLTYTAKIANVSGNSASGSGMSLRDTTSGRYIKLIVEGNKVNISRWNSDSSFNSTTFSEDVLHNNTVWFQVEDNGTNFLFKISAGGGAWITLLSESRTAWLAAADEIGFMVEAGQAGRVYNLAVLHYEEA